MRLLPEGTDLLPLWFDTENASSGPLFKPVTWYWLYRLTFMHLFQHFLKCYTWLKRACTSSSTSLIIWAAKKLYFFDNSHWSTTGNSDDWHSCKVVIHITQYLKCWIHWWKTALCTILGNGSTFNSPSLESSTFYKLCQVAKVCYACVRSLHIIYNKK